MVRVEVSAPAMETGRPRQRIPRPVDLIESHLGLAARIARREARYLPRTLLIEDLVQSATLALIECAHRYNHRLGVPFQAYARHRIRGSLLDLYRRGAYRWEHREPELSEADCAIVRCDLAWLDAALDDQRRAARLMPLIGTLPRRQRAVINNYYRRGRDQERIGRRLRPPISPQRVSQIRMAALVRLREMAEERGIV